MSLVYIQIDSQLILNMSIKILLVASKTQVPVYLETPDNISPSFALFPRIDRDLICNVLIMFIVREFFRKFFKT